MKFRRAVEADHERIMELQAKYPDRFQVNPYEPVNGPVFVAEDGGEIVGVGIYRRTAEAFMALEPSLSNFRKAKATRGLAELGGDELAKIGYCEYHIYTTDPAFAELSVGLRGAHADQRKHVYVDVSKRV